VCVVPDVQAVFCRRRRPRRQATTCQYKAGQPGTCDRARHRVGRDVGAHAARLGLDASTFGGHSLRPGFVTSAVKRGANLIKITDVTGHKSLEMLKAYSRDAEAFVGHAGAGLL
jgi:hypothetical protein